MNLVFEKSDEDDLSETQKIETRVTFDCATRGIVENGQKFKKEEIKNILLRVSKIFKVIIFNRSRQSKNQDICF